jgi:hypothetical protein
MIPQRAKITRNTLSNKFAMVYLRLFVGDVNSSYIQAHETSGQYKTPSGKFFRQVRLMGICTRATANAKQMLLEIGMQSTY